MIKLLQILTQQKQLVILALLTPLLGFLLSSKNLFVGIPESESVTYTLKFLVPHRRAPEILERVIQPSEKVLNGLSGLLSLNSETHDHEGTIELRFREGLKAQDAYLYVQEKLDRIKLIVPRDVESIELLAGLTERSPDLIVKFTKQPLTRGQLRVLLGSTLGSISRSVPDLMAQNELRVSLDSERLSREKISSSQVMDALGVSGLSADLGSQAGILFGMGRAFESIEDIQSTVVGSKGQRPVLVQDVSRVQLQIPDSVNDLQLWIDKKRSSPSEIVKVLDESGVEYRVSHVARNESLRLLVQPLLGLLGLIALQWLCFTLVFGKGFPVLSVLLFDALFGVHFLFLKSVFWGQISVLDFHSFILSLGIVTALWVLLFARIRAYFLPQHKLQKIPRKIEQATLFALSELLPTFIVSTVLLALLLLPMLMSAANPVARNQAQTILMLGIPVGIILMSLMPILLDFGWIEASEMRGKKDWDWLKPNPDMAKILIGFHVLCVAALLIFPSFRWGLLGESQVLLDRMRGYSLEWNYLSHPQDQKKHQDHGMDVVKSSAQQVYRVWDFTPHGLKQMVDLNLMTFSSSLQKVERNSQIGIFDESAQALSVRVGANIALDDDMGNLWIASQKRDGQPRLLRTLASPQLETAWSQILRNRMKNSDWVRRTHQGYDLSFRRKFSSPEIAAQYEQSQWTQYLSGQFASLSGYQFMSLVFAFLLISLYLNSFARSGIILVFLTGGLGFFLLVYQLLPGAFHTDSAVLGYLPIWFAITLYLVLARLIDTDRSRGHDRLWVIEEHEVQYSPAARIVGLYFCALLFWMGFLEWIPGVQTLGIWREGMILGILGALCVHGLFKTGFRILYLESEAMLDRMVMLLLRQPKVRFWVKKLVQY